jgi:hypothetical protein
MTIILGVYKDTISSFSHHEIYKTYIKYRKLEYYGMPFFLNTFMNEIQMLDKLLVFTLAQSV